MIQKILIVEDEPITALCFKTFLVKYGYDCCTCNSGETALSKISSEHFDLALLDINLKNEISGLDVGEKLKAINVPVIFISAFSDSQNYNRALELEPRFIFHKPVNLDDLYHKINIVLGEKSIIEKKSIL